MLIKLLKIRYFVLLLSCFFFNNGIAKSNTKRIDIDTFIQGRFIPKNHSDFIKVDKQYASRFNLYLNKNAYNSFKKMHDQARKEGIKLTIISATRSFHRQKNIWERKWKKYRKITSPTKRAKKILRFSSMPSTSRHHWGTDIDINSLSPAYFSTKKGQREYRWLQKNAKKFGFCQPYTKKGKSRPHGYNEEKWHWSYIPIAKHYTDYITEKMDNSMIHGFAGSKTANQINIVDDYMLGINKDCL